MLLWFHTELAPTRSPCKKQMLGVGLTPIVQWISTWALMSKRKLRLLIMPHVVFCPCQDFAFGYEFLQGWHGDCWAHKWNDCCHFYYHKMKRKMADVARFELLYIGWQGLNHTGLRQTTTTTDRNAKRFSYISSIVVKTCTMRKFTPI